MDAIYCFEGVKVEINDCMYHMPRRICTSRVGQSRMCKLYTTAKILHIHRKKIVLANAAYE
jgi:hypothetical protein